MSIQSAETSQLLNRSGSPALAYRHRQATGGDTAGPGVFFLPGYNSDMLGNKAAHLADVCNRLGCAYTRFDYRGHGQSDGTFTDATLSDWLEDAAAILDRCTTGPQILVGSSMGGWIGLLLALQRPARVAGMIFIAPAPDFAERMLARIPDAGRRELMETGIYRAPSQYSDTPYAITQRLIDDAPRHNLLGGDISVQAPVRIMHGQQDPDVPWQQSLTLADKIAHGNVETVFIKDGDHRLSRAADLALLSDILRRLHRDVNNPVSRES